MDPRPSDFRIDFRGERYGRYLCGRAVQLEFRGKETIVVSASTPNYSSVSFRERFESFAMYTQDKCTVRFENKRPKFTCNQILHCRSTFSLPIRRRATYLLPITQVYFIKYRFVESLIEGQSPSFRFVINWKRQLEQPASSAAVYDR